MQSRELQRPLARVELDELTAFLATTPRAMPFPEAHGFLTGIASAPTMISASVWQGEILGEGGFSSMEHAQQIFGLLMRLYNQIVGALLEGKPLVQSGRDDDTVGRWCAGYLKAARLDDVWTSDETGVVFLFPFAVLAGEMELVGERDSDGRIIEDATPQLRRCREGLEATAHEANRYWTAWRRKSIEVPVASRSPKVGRNEPCPCGSGLKFKKCCALNDQ